MRSHDPPDVIQFVHNCMHALHLPQSGRYRNHNMPLCIYPHVSARTHTHAHTSVFLPLHVCVHARAAALLLGERTRTTACSSSYMCARTCTSVRSPMLLCVCMRAAQLPVWRGLERQHAGNHAEGGLLAGEAGCVVHDAWEGWRPHAGAGVLLAIPCLPRARARTTPEVALSGWINLRGSVPSWADCCCLGLAAVKESCLPCWLQ